MFTRKHMLALIVVALAAVSFACVAGTGSYKVSAALFHNGENFASPTVIVTPGVPANVRVTGNNGYQLSLTVTELGTNKVKVAAKLNTAQYGRITPVVTARLGKTATVIVFKNGTALGIKLTATRTSS